MRKLIPVGPDALRNHSHFCIPGQQCYKAVIPVGGMRRRTRHPGTRNMRKHYLATFLLAAAFSQSHAASTQDRAEREKAAPATEAEDPTVGSKDAGMRPQSVPQAGAVNPANGQYYPPTSTGDVINPATGERYLGVPGGYINPNTGEFMPKIR
jgi:hypothetical protein